MRLAVSLFVAMGVLWPAAVSAAQLTPASAQPGIEMNYTIVLSSIMKAALERRVPGFAAWSVQDFSADLLKTYDFKPFAPWKPFLSRQTPSAVIGDFNGDGAADAALLGHDETHGLRLVVLSRKGGYDVVEFAPKYALTDPMTPNHRIGGGNVEEYLAFVAPGKIKAEPAYGRPELNLKADAFELGVFEKASTLYYHDDERWQQQVLSD